MNCSLGSLKRFVGTTLKKMGPVGQRIYDRLSPTEKEFRQAWPMIDSVEGFLVSPMQEHWLYAEAKSLPDGATVVEVGSFKGRSTCCLALGCRGTQKHVFAIDTFKGNEGDFKYRPFLQDFLDNLQRCGLSKYVTPVDGRSSEIAKTWRKPIDLLFIDGSHDYEDVLADFQNFLPYVQPGGVIAFHDVIDTWPGVVRVWRESASPVLVETGFCATLAYGRVPPA